jgi:hypothetical protein
VRCISPLLALSWPHLPCALKAAIGIVSGHWATRRGRNNALGQRAYARPETVDEAKSVPGGAWEAHSTSLRPFGSFTPRMRKNKNARKDFEHNQGAKR